MVKQPISKQNTLMALWILVGFVFIHALDALLYLVCHLIYFLLLSAKLPHSALISLLLISAASFYLIGAFVLIKKVELTFFLEDNSFKPISTQRFILLFILSIFLKPITNRLAGLFGQYNYDLFTDFDFLTIQGMLYFGISLGQVFALIVLAITYFRRYNSK